VPFLCVSVLLRSALCSAASRALFASDVVDGSSPYPSAFINASI
jgi:hypothetical protein